MLLFERTFDVLSTDIKDQDIDFENNMSDIALSGDDALRSLVYMFIDMYKLDVDTNDKKQLYHIDIPVNGENHTIYVLYYIDLKNPDKRYNVHVIGFDYNHVRGEYTVGYINGYQTRNNYFKVTEPILRLIEKSPVPVHIGVFSYTEMLYGIMLYNIDAYQCLKTPYLYMPKDKPLFGNIVSNKNISENVVLFDMGQLNGKWYRKLPTQQSKIISNLPDNFKLSHDFAKKFAGIQNATRTSLSISLYTTMFESADDFAKVVSLFVEKGYEVQDERHNVYNKENYKELLNVDDISKLNSDRESEITENNINNSETEKKSKALITELIGQTACEQYNIINTKVFWNGLTVYRLVKPRKTNDIYRKFDMPVISEFLKDNGIDLTEIIENSHKRAYDIAEKIAKKFYDIKDRNQVFNEKGYRITGYDGYSSTYNYYKNNQLIYYINNASKFGNDIQELVTQLTHEIIKGNSIIQTISSDEIDNGTYKDEKIINYILQQAQSITKSYCMDAQYEIYLLRRFLCLLIKYMYEYDIQELSNNQTLNYGDDRRENVIEDIISKTYRDKQGDNRKLLDMYTQLTNDGLITNECLVETSGQYSGSHGTSTKECVFSLNTYTRMYAFYYCCAKALKNAYNFKILNPLAHDFDMRKEFDTDDEPDMNAVNFSAINKMVQNIFEKMYTDYSKEEKIRKNKKFWEE